MAGPQEQVALEAYAREQDRRRRAGLPELTYGQFLDGTARTLEAKGQAGRARGLRNLQVAQQAGGAAGPQAPAIIGQRIAEERDAAAGNPPAMVSSLVRETPAQAAERATARAESFDKGANRALSVGVLGARALGDTALVGLPSQIGGRIEEANRTDDAAANLRGTRREVEERGAQALREGSGAAGRIAEGTGTVLGFLTPAGAVGRAGKALAVTEKARPVLNTLGRVLSSRVLSLPVAGAAMRVARAGQEAAFGEGERAGETIASIPAGAAQDTLVGLAAIPFGLLGGAIEKGFLKATLPRADLANAWGRTIGELPARNIGQAVAAKALGGAVEFAPFSLVPNLAEHPKEWQTIFDPTQIGSDAWVRAGTTIFSAVADRAMNHTLEEAATGALVGVLGGSPIHRPEGRAEGARLRKATQEEWARIQGEIRAQMVAAAKDPAAQEQILRFLLESQQLRQTVSQQRGDVPKELAAFGDRVGAWAKQRATEAGMVREKAGAQPAEGPAAPPATPAKPKLQPGQVDPATLTDAQIQGLVDGLSPEVQAQAKARLEATRAAAQGKAPEGQAFDGQPEQPPADVPPTTAERPPAPAVGPTVAPERPSPAPESRPPAPEAGQAPAPAPTDPAAARRQRRLANVARGRKKQLLEERRKASTDERTGLSNANAWEAMTARWGRDAEGHPVAPKDTHVWTGDLGEFKALNDTQGHEAGNRALRKVGDALRAAAKAAGIPERNVFRTGGDEFSAHGTREQVEAFHAALEKAGAIEEGGARVHIDGGHGPTFKEADVAAAARKKERKAAAGIGSREQEAAKRQEREAYLASLPPEIRKIVEAAEKPAPEGALSPEDAAALDIEGGTTPEPTPAPEVSAPRKGNRRLPNVKAKGPLSELLRPEAPTEARPPAPPPMSARESAVRLLNSGRKPEPAGAVPSGEGKGKAVKTSDGAEFRGAGAKARAAVWQKNLDLVGAKVASYGGGTDTILGVTRDPATGRVTWRVRDEKGVERSHSTEISRRQVLEEPPKRGAPAAPAAPAAKTEPPATPPAAGKPAAPPPRPRAARVEGREVSIPVPKGAPIRARYAVMEGADLLPSHTGPDFAPSPGYPEGVQERDYSKDVRARDKVQRISRNFNIDEALSTAPRATDGPSTVTPDGTVLNGNGREQARRLALTGAQRGYREALAERASQFGIDPAKLEGMKDPVLVRVVDMDPASKEAKAFARVGNQTGTASVSPLERAMRTSELIPDEVLRAIGSDPELTFSQAVVDASKGREFRRALEDAMAPEERAEFFNADGSLTESGKVLAQNTILAKAIGPKMLADASPQLRRTLADSTIQLAEIRRSEDLVPLSQALDEAMRFGSVHLGEWKSSPKEVLEEQGLLGAPPPISAAARMLLEFLHRTQAEPKNMRRALTDLIEVQRQESGLLGSMPVPEVIREAFEGVPARRKAERAAKEQDVESRMQSVKGASSDEVLGFPLTSPVRATEITAAQRGMLEPSDITLGMPPALPAPSSGVTWRGANLTGKKRDRARVGRHQVTEALAEAFGVEIRVGRLGPENAGAAGIFKMRPEVARVREADNAYVGAHEAGHSIDKLAIPVLQNDPNFNRIRIELLRLGEALYPNMPVNHFREGFAELVRIYTLEGPASKAKAPQAFEWFEKWSAGQKGMAEGIKRTRDLYEQYEAQPALERAKADLRQAEKAARKGLRQSIYDAMYEDLGPIQRATQEAISLGHTLKQSDNPYELASYLRGSTDEVVREMVLGKMRGVAGEEVGKGLNDIYREAGIKGRRDLLEFDAYLHALRGEELWESGRNPGMTRETVKGTIDAIERGADPAKALRWRKAAEQVWEWNAGVLNYAASVGAISGELKAAIMGGSRRYVPLQRFIPGSTKDAGVGGGSGFGGGPIRRLLGSNRQVISPLAAMVSNAKAMVEFTHRRMVADAIVNLSKLRGMGRIVEQVPVEVARQQLGLERIKDQLKAAGADLSQVDPDLLLDLYSPKDRPDSKDPILAYRRPDGTTEWYQVRRDLYNSLSGLDAYRLSNPVARWVLGAPRRLFQAGTTGYRASFGLVTNTLRDFSTHLTQSSDQNAVRAAARWAKNLGTGALETFGVKSEGELAELFRVRGGKISQSLGDITSGFRGTVGNMGRGKSERMLRSTEALSAVRDLLQISESAPRVSEMQHVAKKAGWKPGQPMTLDLAIQIVNAGKRVTTDFSAAGSLAKVINQAVPFFNAVFQSQRGFGRALRRNPVGTTLKGIAALTIPTLLLWWKNKDEDWYADMPLRDRLSHWYVGDPTWDEKLRIPRPFEPGTIFASIPEAIIDAAYRKDPEVVRAGFAQLLENANPFPVQPTLDVKDGGLAFKFNPSGLPVLAAEAAEQGLNRDFYFDQPIVPRSQVDRPAKEQRGPFTSGAAEWLGAKLGWSPRRIDHAIAGLAGGVGTDTTGLLDKLSGRTRGAEREGTISDIPVAGTLFTRGGKEGIGSRAVTTLYDALAAARERQGSKDDPETAIERERRNVLEDGAAAVDLLREAQRTAKGSAERQAIQREIRAAARGAIAKTETVAASAGSLGAARAALDRKIQSAMADLSHAVDGTGPYEHLTPSRRGAMRERHLAEIEEIARGYAEELGVEWRGSAAATFPKLAGRIDVALDPRARKRPRLPGSGVGAPPSKDMLDAMDRQQTLPGGGR